MSKYTDVNQVLYYYDTERLHRNPLRIKYVKLCNLDPRKTKFRVVSVPEVETYIELSDREVETKVFESLEHIKIRLKEQIKDVKQKLTRIGNLTY